MTNWIDDMAEHVLDVFGTDKMGTAITYNGTPINAVVTYGEDDDGRSIFEIMDIVVQSGDVPAPAYRDQAVVDSATWYFWKQIQSDQITKTLRLKKEERPRGR